MNARRACVLYARKSTDREDKQILSIDAQLRALREYATRSGLVIVQELEESCSARKPGRPIFSQLLKNAEAGRVERILAWRLDRLARNPVDGGQLIFLLGEGKLKELVTPEGIYTGGADSKFMLSVHFGAATKMTDDLSAGVKRGNRELLERGRIPWRAPIGYRKIRDRSSSRGAGKTVRDPRRFPILQRMWKEMASGTTTVSALWRRTEQEWGLRLGFSHMYEIFRNPFYAGVISSPHGTFPGEHEPMVTPEEFRRVQELIRPASTPRPSRHEFVYRGLLHCGRCSRLFVGERHTKPSNLVFTYYRCSRRHPAYEVCHASPVREEAVTADINRELHRLILPENLAAWTRDALEYWAAQEKGSASERLRAMQDELHAAEQSRERMVDHLLSGRLREDDYDRRLRELEARIAALHDAIREPEAEVAGWRARVEEVLTAGCRVADVLSTDDAADRRALLAQVCSNLVVTERITMFHWRFPFTLLTETEEVSKMVSEVCSDPLPSPELVLSQNKKARRSTARERALSAWWTKVEQVRTKLFAGTLS